MIESELLFNFMGKINTNNRIIIGMQPNFFYKVLNNISPKMLISIIPETMDERSRITSVIYENKLQIKDINFILTVDRQTPYLNILFIDEITPVLVKFFKNLLNNQYTSPHDTFFVCHKSLKKNINNIINLKWEKIDNDWIYTQYKYNVTYTDVVHHSLFMNEAEMLFGENEDV